MANGSNNPDQPTVASVRVARILRERILSGGLRPGDRIRQEEVAAELDTSRIPVREALRILQTQGLVTLRSNSGAWVSRLNLRECSSAYQIRERLEPLVLAESIPNLTIDDLAELDRLVGRVEAATDIESFLELDRDLHLATYRGSAAGEALSVIERQWNVTQPYRRAYLLAAGPERDWIVQAEHRLLLDSIRRGDTWEAEQILAIHIRRTRVALQARPDLFD